MSVDLVPLLEPRSVAVVGASDRGDKPGARLARVLAGGAFDGKVWGVNPREISLEGVEWVPSVDELPEPVDLACLAVGAELAVGTVEHLADQGLARAAIVYSSGFSESDGDGAKRERRLVEVARASRMPVCGPNTAGIISLERGFVGSFTHALADGLPERGSVMVITQSGAVGGILLTRLRELGVGISHWVSVGNGAVLATEDYLRFAGEDEATTSVVLFLEGLEDGARFRAAVEACRAAGKAVAAYKAGTTEAGAAAARSHTGKLAGSDRTYDAAFRQLGIRRAPTLHDLGHLAMAADWWRPARGRRAALVSVSGAGCTILADEAARAGLTLAELSVATRERLRELVPGYAQQQNPVDLTGSVLEDLDRLRGVVAAVQADEGVDVIAMAFATNTEAGIARAVVDAWDTVKPLAVVLPVSEHASRAMRAVFGRHHVAAFPDFASAVATLAAFTPGRRGAGVRNPRALSGAPDAAREGWVGWQEAAEVLTGSGVPVARTERVGSAAEAGDVVSSWAVDRVVLKLDHPAVLHKTDVGGVAVGVTPAEVEQVCSRMAAAVADVGQCFEDGGAFLVQEHVSGGVEALVGLTRDPTFGPVVTLGVGGTAVEAWGEVSSLVVPYRRDDVWEAIGTTKLAALLEGARGGRPDVDSFVALVDRFQGLAGPSGSLEEADLNPVMITPHGSVVVDARLRLARSRAGPGRREA